MRRLLSIKSKPLALGRPAPWMTAKITTASLAIMAKKADPSATNVAKWWWLMRQS